MVGSGGMVFGQGKGAELHRLCENSSRFDLPQQLLTM